MKREINAIALEEALNKVSSTTFLDTFIDLQGMNPEDPPYHVKAQALRLLLTEVLLTKKDSGEVPEWGREAVTRILQAQTEREINQIIGWLEEKIATRFPRGS